ncbi:hypothetical protein CIB93_32140 [Streptomyces sp. WZ.A104]|uniref:anthrone oxygenase family protein n=1 Tax=Streptomyces sp. WZ.A104 TaxID=2023771 RepID=UPI000BBBAF4A|nr:anthrone oxygenase family protein [Streptomyces sp. WZ.A104]PCG82051.1 hypothetical protein CIB93_32140 [Streptomyces sp. WZ.A104]
MRGLQTGALLAATLSTGLMAGLFAAFAYGVMPGLARSSDRTLIETMQTINMAILNPVFILPFLGSIPLLGLSVYLARQGHGRLALSWLVAALVLYVVAFLVTLGASAPLNLQLANAGAPDDIKDLAAVRADFETKWVVWNIVRALLHTAAFACLLWALVVYGGQRSQETGGLDAPDRPTSVHPSVEGTRT